MNQTSVEKGRTGEAVAALILRLADIAFFAAILG